MAADALGLQQTFEPEILDGRDYTPAELSANFRDIRRVNRYLGGTRLTRWALAPMLRPGGEYRLLDLGTGSADIPGAIHRWAQEGGTGLRITATDIRDDVLGLASAPAAGITLERADATRLPYADRSFDFVTSSLLLHHLVPEDALAMLRESARVATTAVIVNDLLRNTPSYWGARLLRSVATGNRLSRHDGPLSVRRSYTLREIFSLCREAGLGVQTVGTAGIYRVAVVARPGT